MKRLYPEHVSTSAGTEGLSRQWWVLLVWSAIVLVAIALLPFGSAQRSLLELGAGIAASVMFWFTFVTLPRGVRKVWFCLGAFLTLTTIGDVIYDYQSQVLGISPFPGLADVCYLATYPLAIAGLFLLARALNPGADLSSWIDISIMVIAAAGIVGAFVIGPVWTSSDQWDLTTVLSLAYPLLDLVLLAALVRLLLLPHARSAAITLLAASMGLFLAYDLIYNNQVLAAVWTPSSSMDVLWTGAILCIPLAAISPGAQQFHGIDPSQAGIVTTTRQLVIGISVMSAPAIVLLELSITGSLILRWLVPVIIILVALILWRMHLLLRASQRQSAMLAALARTDVLTGLPNRQTWQANLPALATGARQAGRVLTVAILDVDDFTQLRESRGDRIADLMLVSATISWLGELGNDDVLARYGPDEFALAIQRASMAEAQEVLRRVVRATPSGLLISSGAALLRPEEEPSEAQHRAESAMRATRIDALPREALEQELTS